MTKDGERHRAAAPPPRACNESPSIMALSPRQRRHVVPPTSPPCFGSRPWWRGSPFVIAFSKSALVDGVFAPSSFLAAVTARRGSLPADARVDRRRATRHFGGRGRRAHSSHHGHAPHGHASVELPRGVLLPIGSAINGHLPTIAGTPSCLTPTSSHCRKQRRRKTEAKT